jgi:hypothetical protein
MTGGSDPGVGDAQPTLAQEAGAGVSVAVQHLTYMTGV